MPSFFFDGMEFDAAAIEDVAVRVRTAEEERIAKMWEDERRQREALHAQRQDGTLTLSQLAEIQKKNASSETEVAKLAAEIEDRENKRKAELQKVSKFPPPPTSGGSR